MVDSPVYLKPNLGDICVRASSEAKCGSRFSEETARDQILKAFAFTTGEETEIKMEELETMRDELGAIR